MRILTVRQPWAWAIIHGGKDVENRTRNIAGDYRGPVAIHAGLVEDLESYRAADRGDHRALRAALRAGKGWDRVGIPTWRQWGGCIIGVVDLVDVHHGASRECPRIIGIHSESNADIPEWAACSTWAEFGVWHLVLANPRPLAEPIPYRGALGLRELPADVVERILAGVTS